MKLSVSLTEDEVQFLDAATGRGEYSSRSAAVAAAIRALREQKMVQSYAAEFADPDIVRDLQVWDSTLGDGLNE